MLIEFRVKNFRSFRDEQVLSALLEDAEITKTKGPKKKPRKKVAAKKIAKKQTAKKSK